MGRRAYAESEKLADLESVYFSISLIYNLDLLIGNVIIKECYIEYLIWSDMIQTNRHNL